MNKRAGYYKTNISGEAAYQSFVLAPLPPNPPVELDTETVNLLVKANKQLALLRALPREYQTSIFSFRCVCERKR